MAFWREGGTVKRVTYLGSNKEVSDVEVFAILSTVQLFRERDESGQSYTIFSDSRAAISRIQHDRCGPVQALAKAVLATVDELHERGNSLTVRWAPAHVGIEGNKQADEAAGERRRAEGMGPGLIS